MKVLVVDDDVVSRLALAELLEEWTLFDVVVAEDGQAAWRLLEHGLRPLICFCDVRMPHVSGLDLLERIKAHPDLAQMPFVLVSSASDRATVLQAVKLGAVGYILKPVQAATAREHLDNLFRIALDKALEDPRATATRLSITADRLRGYLEALLEQVEGAKSDLDDLRRSGRRIDLRSRLETIHTGCTTLGLWHGVRALVQLRAAAPDGRKLEATLDEVADLAARQFQRLDAAMPEGDPAGRSGRVIGTPAAPGVSKLPETGGGTEIADAPPPDATPPDAAPPGAGAQPGPAGAGPADVQSCAAPGVLA